MRPGTDLQREWYNRGWLDGWFGREPPEVAEIPEGCVSAYWAGREKGRLAYLIHGDEELNDARRGDE